MATNTAASFTNLTGNGTAGPFNISFSYLDESEVDVTVGGVLKTITTHYTFTSATQITFTSGNEPANGVAIKFQRDTNVGSKKVDFVDGSVLTETDLDNNANQLLFSMQEIVDSGAGSSVQSVTGTTPIVSSGGTTPAISISAATTSAAGSMSSADKTKLDGIEASADVTDATNVNAAGAVMNSDLDGKGELLVGDGSGDPTALAAGANGYVLKANSSTATGLEWAAESGGGSGEANQNAFSAIAVSGQSNVAADSTTDTLNIAAGSNVTITTDAGSDTVTIASTDTNTTYSVGDGGLTQNNFTDALKTKLDGIAANANVGLTDLVGDSSPQLAADLDVQANEITTSTSNGNIKLNPNGTGVVEVKGDGSSADGTLQLNCSQNSHGIKLKSPPHSAGASYTLTFPNTDGNANQVLKTDGSGGLDWVDQSSSGISNLVEDTTPQLGGNLDMQANNITGTGTITANSVANTANGMRKITASTSSPSGGADGDIWIKYTA